MASATDANVGAESALCGVCETPPSDSEGTEAMLGTGKNSTKKIKAPAPLPEGAARGSKRARKAAEGKEAGVIMTDISKGLEPVKIRAVNQARDVLCG